MTALNRIQFSELVAAQLPTNDRGLIQASNVRTVSNDLADSVPFMVDAAAFTWVGATIEGEAIQITGQFSWANVWFTNVRGTIARGIAFGLNSDSQSANWPVVNVVGSIITDVVNNASSQTIGLISYASVHTLFAFNFIKDIGGPTDVEEVDSLYTKSPHSIAIGNYAEGIETSSSAKYFFNQKGGKRGGDLPGYGGTWGFNVAVGDGAEIGTQLQSGEATSAFCHYDNVIVGTELGSTTADMDAVVGTMAILTGASTTRGLTASTSSDSSMIVSALNRYRNAYYGTRVSSTGGATINGFLSLGDQAEIVSIGFDITGQLATPMQGVRIAHPYISGGAIPVTLTDVLGGMIDAPYFTGYSDDRPIRFTRAKDIFVRGHRVRLQLSGTTATNLFRFTLAAGDACSIRVHIAGRATDDSQAFGYTVDGAVWNNAGTVTVLGTPIVTGAGSTSMVGPTISGSGNDLRIRMAAGTGLTWDTTAVLDLLKY